ncbi:MAG: alpha-galactosidase [Planctomycetaceae bacterium]
MTRLLLVLLIAFSGAHLSAVDPTTAEMKSVRNWFRAGFYEEGVDSGHDGYLEVQLEHGPLLKNMATTKVYHKQLGALPLKINRKTYQHGLYLSSPGSIRVVLPGPARKFDAIFGVDSNRVTSFYSNAGRGAVIGTVTVDGKVLYRSPVMKEGMHGEKVSVALGGAQSLLLHVHGSGRGIIEQVDFNQSDWANAEVEMIDGRRIRLGDLPTAPLAERPETDVPFSFIYNGTSSREFLGDWQKDVKELGQTIEQETSVVSYRDPMTGLVVECELTRNLSLPVMEWVLRFRNESDKPIPLIENVLPLDCRFNRNGEDEFVLHHSNGSPHSLVRMSDETDYAPRTTTLFPESTKQLESLIGLPASNDLPFFNVEWNRSGAIFAIGWPGQWRATLERNNQRRLEIKAGQQDTAFYLTPGEQVRTPRIAMLLWQGDSWLRAQNLWRRWMIESNLPRTSDGALPPFQHNASSSAHFIESSGATESNQKMFVDRYVDNGIKPDYWWIDAGWYDYTDYWLNVGTWNPNKKRFPNGLKPISDHLHNRDMKFILWFTPELVTRGSELDRNQKQWLLKGGAEWWMGHALIQGEFPAHVNDSGLTLMEDVAAFGTGNPDATATSKLSLADGKWHLVTATRFINEQTNRSEIKLFVDGQESAVAESGNTGLMDRNDSFGVGRQFQTRGIVGEIDDVRVYDVALTAGQVKELFEHRLNFKPLHHYPFNGNVEDVAGSIDGDKIGSGEFRFVKGVLKGEDQALAFNNDYGVKIPNSAHANYTLSCWVRMDAAQAPPWGRGDMRLFNFGDAQAAAWMTDYVDSRIESQGVDLYRHDGIPPLAYWKSNDEPGRHGISEMKHVEGLLNYWDTLRERNPMLRIDICSGGGSRNELETLRRAVPLWRSDYAYETTGMQTLSYGMALWIPYFGTGINTTDSYTFWSQLAPSNTTTWDVRREDFDFDAAAELLEQRRQVISYYYDDYYPLTRYRTDNDVWMAWQFNRPADSSGVVLAFRRPDSQTSQMQLKLHGLELSTTYVVSQIDGRVVGRVSGAKLSTDGLLVDLPKPRMAGVYQYRKR